MAKSKKLRKSIMKKMYKNTLPFVNNNLTKIGKTTKSIVTTSVPIVEKGVSAVYGTMATGFDLGVRGAKSVANHMKKSRTRKHKRRH